MLTYNKQAVVKLIFKDAGAVTIEGRVMPADIEGYVRSVLHNVPSLRAYIKLKGKPLQDITKAFT